MMDRWISTGSLDRDPFEEFWVRKDPDMAHTPEGLWVSVYSLRPDMIPEFLGRQTAEEVRHLYTLAHIPSFSSRTARRWIIVLLFLLSFLYPCFCPKVLRVGKTIHFIRQCCGEPHWTLPNQLPEQSESPTFRCSWIWSNGTFFSHTFRLNSIHPSILPLPKSSRSRSKGIPMNSVVGWLRSQGV